MPLDCGFKLGKALEEHKISPSGPKQFEDKPSTPTRNRSWSDYWLRRIIPIVSCLALALSAIGIIRDFYITEETKRSERIRTIQSNILTLAELEGEHVRRLITGQSPMLTYTADINTRRNVLLDITSYEVNNLIDVLQPSLLVTFAYYQAASGNFETALNYLIVARRKLERQSEHVNLSALNAMYIGLAMIYFVGPDSVANIQQGRESFTKATKIFEGKEDPFNQGSLMDVLTSWWLYEKQTGHHDKAEELQTRVLDASLKLSPQDPRRIAVRDNMLPDPGGVHLQNLVRISGSWRIEFLEDKERSGMATIGPDLSSSGWNLQMNIYRNSRTVQQWVGHGTAMSRETVIFTLQGSEWRNEYSPAFPLGGSAQLHLRSNDHDSLTGYLEQLGSSTAGIELRRNN